MDFGHPDGFYLNIIFARWPSSLLEIILNQRRDDGGVQEFRLSG
jgi:hypothetical protein